MEVRVSRLESIVEQMGEVSIAATEAVERLSHRVENLAGQVQQQGYQILALSDAVQTLADTQEATLRELSTLTQTLQRFITLMEEDDSPPAL